MAALTTTAMDNEGPAVAEAQVTGTGIETEIEETEETGTEGVEKARKLIIIREIIFMFLG